MENKYYMVNDGWFIYFVNEKTGKKKLTLDPGDVVVRRRSDCNMFVAMGRAFN